MVDTASYQWLIKKNFRSISIPEIIKKVDLTNTHICSNMPKYIGASRCHQIHQSPEILIFQARVPLASHGNTRYGQ